MNGRRRLVAVLALLAFAGPAHAEFKKGYFGATTPGSFAKMRSTDDKGAVTEYTYSRLADQGGMPWLELKYQAVSGQFKGTMSVTGCLLPATFPLDRDAIDFQAHAKRCAAYSASPGAPVMAVTEYPAATMKAIASGVISYGSIVTFKGTEMVDGRSCDRYGYAFKTNYMNAKATMTGDLWMNDSVPFGVVKDASVTREDSSGKVLYTFNSVLAASGGGATSGLKGWSWGVGASTEPATRRADRDDRSGRAHRDDTSAVTRELPGMPLAEAFASGQLTIRGDVPAGGAKGRLRLRLSTRGGEALRVSLTQAPMSLTVGPPLDTLTVAADADRVVELLPGKAPVAVEVTQPGPRRATGGTFTIGTFEGRPFLQGDVRSAKAE
jgi:hypothetical protein